MRRMEGCSSSDLACHERHSASLLDVSNREHGALSLHIAAIKRGVETVARRMEGCSNKHQPVQGAAGDTQKELTKV